MGDHNVNRDTDAERRRIFLRHVLDDVRALERALDRGLIETGVRRIGAEQELFLVDSSWRPAPIAEEVLRSVNDPHFTTELARYNLEFNLDPLLFGGRCLSDMERQITERLDAVRSAAATVGADVVLSGILPTLAKTDLTLENMTPAPRYAALNEALTALRGGTWELYIKGIDELKLHHDSVMTESCNTSFQVHFQVGPDEFVRLYNAAQAAAPAVLAAASFSPLLFGKRLWAETRIALFQQSIDTRQASPYVRDNRSRVRFGRDWVRESVLELFREDIARFRSILSAQIEDDPFADIANGHAPQLRALMLHNSTVYRWNRICYGVTDGIGRLRIENRILPSGPTPRDEVANAAFWFGLVSGTLEAYDDISAHLEFDEVKAGFFAAAQMGLKAQLAWVDVPSMPARSLILDTLLPLARNGLAVAGIEQHDIDTYLDVIAERVDRSATGSQWMLRSLTAMGQRGTSTERLTAVTAAAAQRQRDGSPVHTWELAQLTEAGGWSRSYVRVDQCMRTDMVTVQEDEPLELVAHLMDWNDLRHVLVEDSKHRLVGLISDRILLRALGQNLLTASSPTPVSDIMQRDPRTVSPQTHTLEAVSIMRTERVSCLPVVSGGHLVGLITDRMFMEIAAELLEEKLTT